MVIRKMKNVQVIFRWGGDVLPVLVKILIVVGVLSKTVQPPLPYVRVAVPSLSTGLASTASTLTVCVCLTAVNKTSAFRSLRTVTP